MAPAPNLAASVIVPGSRRMAVQFFTSTKARTSCGWTGFSHEALGNWRRGTDYYDEGDLLWLEVATIIHRESGGKKSIDDFCQEFPRRTQSRPGGKDLYLRRVGEDAQHICAFRLGWTFSHPVDFHRCGSARGRGIENSGWKVTFSDKPAKLEGRRGNPGDVYSIGLAGGKDGTVTDAIVGSPAFEAGISSQMKIIGVYEAGSTLRSCFLDAIKSYEGLFINRLTLPRRRGSNT